MSARNALNARASGVERHTSASPETSLRAALFSLLSRERMASWAPDGERTNSRPSDPSRSAKRAIHRSRTFGQAPRTRPCGGSSGSAPEEPARAGPDLAARECSVDGGRRLASRRGVLIEVGAKIPTLECELLDGCRRHSFDPGALALPGRFGMAYSGRRLLRPSCPRGQPHPRLPRSACVWAGETGRSSAPALRVGRGPRAHRRRS